MLKSAGVDRFSLAARLREMDPEQAANLARIYNAQLGVVLRRVEEVRLCENYLLQKGFSRRLEEELIPQLPLEKDELARLASGPSGPFHAVPEALPDIARRSPLGSTRTLARIALLRRGCFEETFGAACQALGSDDPELALEAALAFAHWRVRLFPWSLWRSHPGVDRRRLAEVAETVPSGSPLRSWAAAAFALAWGSPLGATVETGEELPGWVSAELRGGLSSSNPDLRFTCALALGEDGILIRALESGDAQQRTLARRFLAKSGSPAVGPLLADGSAEIRAEILGNLSAPLTEDLVEPVLLALERSDRAIRADGVRLLLPTLTDRVVQRLVRLAQSDGDTEVLKLLLGSQRLPDARRVVRAVIRAGFLEMLANASQHVDFSDEAVWKLAAEGGPAVLDMLIRIADRQLDELSANDVTHESGTAVARFLARIAFGSRPVTNRWSAYRVLDRCNPQWWDWLSPAGFRELFGSAERLLSATVPLLDEGKSDPISGKLLEKLSDCWAEAGMTLTGDRPALEQSVRVLQKLASPASRDETRHQVEAARLLVAVALSCPDAALPAVSALLRDQGEEWECRDIPRDLLAGYDVLSRGVKRSPSLVADLADALAALIGDRALRPWSVPAIELLTRLARDHTRLRSVIGARVAPRLANRDREHPDFKPSLDKLANAVQFKHEAEEQIPKEHAESLPPPELFDHLILIPNAPLKTLAEYVGFLKAMNTAANPMAVVANFGMTQDSFVECVSLWGAVLAENDDIAIRYSQLMSPEKSDKP